VTGAQPLEETPAIAVQGVSRVYRTGPEDVAAISDVSMVVGSGEMVALMGPSGSGKTTLLNLIAALDRPTQGEIAVLGQPISSLSERAATAFRARTLGLVFQDPHLLPGLTALENVIAARLPWSPVKRLAPEARTLLEAVGLADRMHHPPGRLSGGERQRVSLARALLGGPRILLADEPTGNLDRTSTESLIELLRALRRSHGLTVVVATHDPRVSGATDRILELRSGRLNG
jgi:ABC-type lipoprotein export system ATPase subunit